MQHKNDRFIENPLHAGSFYLMGNYSIFYQINKLSGQNRTAAERNYVAKTNPPQAHNPAVYRI